MNFVAFPAATITGIRIKDSAMRGVQAPDTIPREAAPVLETTTIDKDTTKHKP